MRITPIIALALLTGCASAPPIDDEIGEHLAELTRCLRARAATEAEPEGPAVADECTATALRLAAQIARDHGLEPDDWTSLYQIVAALHPSVIGPAQVRMAEAVAPEREPYVIVRQPPFLEGAGTQRTQPEAVWTKDLTDAPDLTPLPAGSLSRAYAQAFINSWKQVRPALLRTQNGVRRSYVPGNMAQLTEEYGDAATPVASMGEALRMLGQAAEMRMARRLVYGLAWCQRGCGLRGVTVRAVVLRRGGDTLYLAITPDRMLGWAIVELHRVGGGLSQADLKHFYEEQRR